MYFHVHISHISLILTERNDHPRPRPFFQAVVAQYHVESSGGEEEADEAGENEAAHEKEGLMSYQDKWRAREPLWGESFAMNALSSEDDDEGRKSN